MIIIFLTYQRDQVRTLVGTT